MSDQPGVTRPRSQTFLPLSDEFRRPYDSISNFNNYMERNAPAELRDRYNARMRPSIRNFQDGMIERFKKAYKDVFPSRSTERVLTPDDADVARARVQPLVDEAEHMMGRVRGWAEATGRPEFGPQRFDGVLNQGHQAWQQRYQGYKSAIDNLIGRYTYKGQPLGYIGSMKSGFRGPHKGKTQVDLNSFDVDLYVVHPEEFERLRGPVEQRTGEDAGDKIFSTDLTDEEAGELNGIARDIARELVEMFPGNAAIDDSPIVIRQNPPY